MRLSQALEHLFNSDMPGATITLKSRNGKTPLRSNIREITITLHRGDAGFPQLYAHLQKIGEPESSRSGYKVIQKSWGRVLLGGNQTGARSGKKSHAKIIIEKKHASAVDAFFARREKEEALEKARGEFRELNETSGCGIERIPQRPRSRYANRAAHR
ncbi:MAG: hypothetical protein V1644_00445 [Candidatus Micrarchaeota archaeon]